MDLVSAPTTGPTTPNGNLVDECDDDQANCHSGTGDDFQLTGAETISIPMLCHFSSYCHWDHLINAYLCLCSSSWWWSWGWWQNWQVFPYSKVWEYMPAKATLPEDMHLYCLHVKNLFLIVTAIWNYNFSHFQSRC